MNKRNIATSPCGGAITREKKDPIRSKMFVKEHIVCRSVSGQVSTQHRAHHLQGGRSCQRAVDESHLRAPY